MMTSPGRLFATSFLNRLLWRLLVRGCVLSLTCCNTFDTNTNMQNLDYFTLFQEVLPILRPFARYTTHHLCPSTTLHTFSFLQYSKVVDEHHGDMEENTGSEGWNASMTCLGISLREDRDEAITKKDLEHPETLTSSLNQWKLEMFWYIEANETTRLVTFPNATHCYGGFKVIWSPQVYIAWVDSTTGLQYHQLFNCNLTQAKSKGNPYHNIYVDCSSFYNEMSLDMYENENLMLNIADPAINLHAQVPLCKLDRKRTIDKFSFCSAPMFHVDRMEAKWPGIVEQWVLYHHQLLGLGKMYLYDIDGSLEKYVQRVAALGYVEYVKKFAVSEDCRKKAEEEGYVYCSQVHAENHCIWRTRGLSEYTIKIHNVDAYIGDHTVGTYNLGLDLDQFNFNSITRVGSFYGLPAEVCDRGLLGKVSHPDNPLAEDIFQLFPHPIAQGVTPMEPIVDPHLSAGIMIHKPLHLHHYFSDLDFIPILPQQIMHYTNLFVKRDLTSATRITPLFKLEYQRQFELILDISFMPYVVPNLRALKMEVDQRWKLYQLRQTLEYLPSK